MENCNPQLSDTPPSLKSLAEMFAALTDQRAPRGKRYKLFPLLMMIMIAKLANVDRPTAIADWVEDHADWLRNALELEWKRTPHASTFRRLMQSGLRLKELETQARLFCASLCDNEKDHLNLDGKTLRGTIPGGETQGVHLLSVQEAETCLVLGQVAVDHKENEITAAPALLAAVEIEGKTISGDAMHTQRKLSEQIVGAGADYLWIVKKNQPALYQHLEKALGPDAKMPADVQTFGYYDKGHGRIEHRQITVSARVANELDWPGVEQAFAIARQRTEVRTDKTTEETVYGITSLAPLKAGPEDLLDKSRKHWSIENGLHYRRDVTFHEDDVRMKSAAAAEVMAVFNNLSIGLLRRGWDNVARARRYYAAHLDEALSLIQTVFS